MKIKNLTALCLGFILWNMSACFITYCRTDRTKKTDTDNGISVLITRKKSFLIYDEENKKIATTDSPYQFFRRLSFITKENETGSIKVYAEKNCNPMIFFDQLTEDSTIIKELNYETKNGCFFITARFLECPSRNLVFEICM